MFKVECAGDVDQCRGVCIGGGVGGSEHLRFAVFPDSDVYLASRDDNHLFIGQVVVMLGC